MNVLSSGERSCLVPTRDVQGRVGDLRTATDLIADRRSGIALRVVDTVDPFRCSTIS